MKTCVLRFILFCLIGGGGTARSAIITWTNAAGGDWHDTHNWSPNQAPVSGDDVIITNSGSYAITNASNLTLDNLTLGGTNGTQTLTISSLTLTNIGLVNSNGVLNWNSGTINGAMTVAQGGVLNITISSSYYIYGALTNNGTVNWSAGSIYGFGPPSYSMAIIANAGLWNAQFDGSLTLAGGAPVFINTGTFRKSGGTGTTSIGWNFTSTGIFDIQTGSLSSSTWVGDSLLNGNYTGTIGLTDTNATLLVASNAVCNWNSGTINGAMTAAPGGVLNITNNTTYYISGALTNNGTVNWSAGSIYGYGPPSYSTAIIANAGLWNAQFDGSLALAGGAPVFINTGTFRKSGGAGTTSIGWNLTSTGTFDTQTGSLSVSTWAGNNTLNGNYTGSATINGGVTLTVATNAFFNWNSGTINGAMTVAQGGVLNITNNTTYYISGALTNNGTVNWSAGSIYGYGPPSYSTAIIANAGLWNAQFDGSALAGGAPVFINTGTFRKSGGTGTTSIGWDFTSTGTLDIQTGSLSTSAWVGNNTLNGNYTGTIGVNTNTTVTVAANVTVNWTGGTIAAGGVFNVSSNAVVNWGGGTVNGSLTVEEGGVLNITNSSTYYIYGALTNNGTVNWSAGSIYGFGPPSYSTAIIANAGLWNAQFDGSLTLAGGAPVFINTGTFKKSGGTGITSIGWNFTSTGIFDIQTGSLSSSTWVGNSILNGNCTGTISLTDTNATVLVASNAVFNWNSGTINGAMTVAPGGVLNITNSSTYYIYGALKNNGTVNWSAGSIYGYGPPSYSTAIIANAGLWNAQFDGSLALAGGAPVFINTGTFRKSGGTGTTSIGWNFTNSVGMLDAQTNTISLTGNYDLTGGTLNIGINSLANNGVIHLSGSPVALTGIFSANLNNGYVPATGSSFPVLTYSSKSGTFTNFNLPFPVAWQTNYGNTTFTLTVLNVRPTLAAIANQTVDELTLLTVTNSATDPDVGQTLTFALVSPPSGMTNNPTSGTISWTPAQTQSPATNTVLVSVTDNGTPSLSATNAFNVIVREVNAAPSLPMISTQTVNELSLLTVADTATNSNIHSAITGYALVSPPSNMVINASGIITWTPAQDQSPGTNLITTIVTNSNPFDLTSPRLTATNTLTVIVKEVNKAPDLPAISAQTITLLRPFSITNSATESNIHSVTGGYLLLASPAGAAINNSGVITWPPAQNQSLTTNTITTVVTNSNPYDLVNPNLSSTNSFSVIVVPDTIATNITALNSDGSTLTLSWPADHTGWRLEIQTNTLAEGISTNWVTFTGSSATNEEIIPIVRTNNTVFFRMVYP